MRELGWPLDFGDQQRHLGWTIEGGLGGGASGEIDNTLSLDPETAGGFGEQLADELHCPERFGPSGEDWL